VERLRVLTGRQCCRGHDELFARVQRHYDDDTIAELTMIIAWENASSRFNRAFRIPSQGFWKR
jgi:alkylhydroperoxidase family enzyme